MTLPSLSNIEQSTRVRPVDSDAMIAAANAYVSHCVSEVLRDRVLQLSLDDRDLSFGARTEVMSIAQAALRGFANELSAIRWSETIPWRVLVGWDPIQLKLYVRVMRKDQ